MWKCRLRAKAYHHHVQGNVHHGLLDGHQKEQNVGQEGAPGAACSACTTATTPGCGRSRSSRIW